MDYALELPWDPDVARAQQTKAGLDPTKAVQRIHRDLRDLIKHPLPGVVVSPDDENLDVVHALITGPFDTPYEGDFFHFLLFCPHDFPVSPPSVKLMTTGGGQVIFNPNLYIELGVLSILGTWQGPGWSPVQTIGSVLLSIQSLMNERPFFYEPGLEKALLEKSVHYNQIITHETVRVAVLAQLCERPKAMPERLHEVILATAPLFADRYFELCDEKCEQLDETAFRDASPFDTNKGTFAFRSLQAELGAIFDGPHLDAAAIPPSVAPPDPRGAGSCVCAAGPPPGLTIMTDFISLAEECELLECIASQPYKESHSTVTNRHLRKQSYGPRVNFKKKKVKTEGWGGHPHFSKALILRLQQLPALSSFQPVETTVLEYDASQGASIQMHRDDVWIWGDRIVGINLLSDCSMTFSPINPDEVEERTTKVEMPRFSLYIMQNEARNDFSHGILEGDIRDRRVSITFRELSPSFEPGGANSLQGDEILTIANSFQGIINSEI